MAFLAVAGGSLFGGGAFGSLAFKAVLGVGMIGLSFLMQNQQKQKGPRLASLDVSDMPIGDVIPLKWGVDVSAMTCIWIRNNRLIEESRDEGGGKGGPKVTKYFYYLTGAWAIADNYQEALLKLWGNDKLISNFDASSGQVDRILTGMSFRFYNGTETQNPDPTMEATLGVGNTPAYRGLCYIVFNRMPLEKFGNTIPQFRALTAQGAQRQELGETYPNGGSSGHAYTIDWSDTSRLVTVRSTSPYTMTLYDIASGNILATGTNLYPETPHQQVVYYTDTFGNLYVASDSGGALVAIYDVNTLQYKGSIDLISYSSNTCDYSYCVDETGQEHLLVKGLTTLLSGSGDYFVSDYLLTVGGPILDAHHVFDTSIDIGDMIVLSGAIYNAPIFADSPTIRVYQKSQANKGTWDNVSLSGRFSTINGVGYYPDEDVLIVHGWDASDTSIYRISKYNYNPFFTQLTEFDTETYAWGSAGGQPYQQMINGLQRYDIGYLVIGNFSGADDNKMYLYNLATMSVEYNINPSSTSNFGDNANAGTYLPDQQRIIVNGGTAREVPVNAWTGDQVSIKTIIDDINSRVGMPTNRCDTTELAPELIDGFTWQESASISEAINDIAVVWGFDLADIGDKLKYIMRGSQTPITIDPEDLGADEGSEEAEFDLQIEVQEGFEMPKTLTLKHKDPDSNYEESIQITQRRSEVVASRDYVEISTRMVLDKDVAAGKLHDLMKAYWRGRIKYNATLPPSYNQYATGNVFQITYQGYLHEFICEEITFDPAVVSVTGTMEDVTDWSSSINGISTQVTTQTINNYSDPRLWLLDVNAMRDADFDYKHYMTVHAKTASRELPGAVIFKGVTTGTLSEWEERSPPVDFGIVVTKPVNVPYPQMTDTASTLDIYINDNQGFTPQSASLDDLLADPTLNALMLPTTYSDGTTEVEYIQYADAVETSTNLWRFTNLIRGCRGTEHMIPFSASSANFALFPAVDSIDRLGYEDEVGLARHYQAVTFGGIYPSTNTIHEFTNTSKALRPYSPDHLGGERDKTTEALTISWLRRTAYQGQWIEGQEVPLEYDTEEYTLRIYDDDVKTTLLRTETITSTTEYEYTLANYNTDTGGSATEIPQVYASVAQVGDDYGEGVATEGYV